MNESRSISLSGGLAVAVSGDRHTAIGVSLSAASTLTTGELWSARNSLELRLRTSAGVAFQDFFSTVMENKLEDDFVRVRPFGSLGDRGCDGYQQSTGRVYQCYGALNGETNAVTKLVTKLKEDFATAHKDPELGSIMKEWCFAHNLIAGTPIEAVLALDALGKQHPTIKFAFMAPATIVDTVLKLSDLQREQLIGPTLEPYYVSVEIAELRTLVGALAMAANDAVPSTVDLRPVPVEKLDFNDLPHRWKVSIQVGWQSTHVIGEYIDNHSDPTVGDRVATLFRARYKDLKMQGLTPAVIMDNLYEVIIGYGTPTMDRMVAAQSLLAFLFENCEIFERGPVTQ